MSEANGSVPTMARVSAPLYDLVATLEPTFDKPLDFRVHLCAFGEDNDAGPAVRAEAAPRADQGGLTEQRGLPTEAREAGTVLGWVEAHKLHEALKLR